MRQKPMPLGEIVQPLLLWYKNQARNLPWREEATPYRVWISEIMLQQTRVEAVKPYFEKFIAELPSVEALAAVSEEKLFKLWEGLGYYSRARNLRKAAQELVRSYGGQLPADFAALVRLPGIGRYSAGAVASIAYGIAVPAVDGNVLRVITRLQADDSDIAKDKTRRAIEGRLQAIMPSDQPGALNQALMELGATTCLPKGGAKCPLCPLRRLCLSHAEDLTAQLPRKSPKKPRRIEPLTVFILVCRGKIALRKRPNSGLLAGLWEPPQLSGHLSAEESYAALPLGKERAALIALPAAKHIFTHIEWQMQGYAAVLSAPPEIDGLRWFTLPQLTDEIALPSAFQSYRKYILSYCKSSSTR